MNMDLAFAIFEELPYIELIAAADAETGIEMALARRPDLIIMDINLPGMDGVTAARVIAAHESLAGTPVIGLSAAAMREDVSDALASGFLEYVTKPIDIDAFLALIRRILPEDPPAD